MNSELSPFDQLWSPYDASLPRKLMDYVKSIEGCSLEAFIDPNGDPHTLSITMPKLKTMAYQLAPHHANIFIMCCENVAAIRFDFIREDLERFLMMRMDKSTVAIINARLHDIEITISYDRMEHPIWDLAMHEFRLWNIKPIGFEFSC
jgi:hypothetical protein